jgi:two-component system, sensor histidine kinase and response regulator
MLKNFWDYFSYLGTRETNDRSNPARLIIFNKLNILAIAATLIRLLLIAVYEPITWVSALINLLPALVCTLNMYLNHRHQFSIARFLGFYALPASLVVVGILESDYGISLFILLLAVISFFFLEKKSSILSSFIFSVLCFQFLRFYEMKAGGLFITDHRWWLTVSNHAVITIIGFFTLSFIKTEIVQYQQQLFRRNQLLWRKNKEVRLQRLEISRQHKAIEEQQKILASSDLLKTRLLSVISHDLRIPLISVKNIFDLYEKQVIERDQMLQYIPELNQEVMNVLDLLENLLAWSKQQTEQMPVHAENMNMSEVIDAVTSLYALSAASKHLQIEKQEDYKTAVLADKQMVKMVLRNFISNAIKFTPIGGKISITHEVKGREVFVHVADNGIGMDERQLAQLRRGEIFTTDGTGSEKGSGIGLNLCHEFIRNNGGRVIIESQQGLGSTFSFVLPLAQTQNATNETITPVVPLYQQGARKEGAWEQLFSEMVLRSSGQARGASQ